MDLPQIVSEYLDAYNRLDVAALVACVSEAVIFENVSNANGSLRIEGRESFAELAGQAATYFTKRHQSVRTHVVDGDRIALDIDWIGTPAIDLGQMKAGVEVALRGASFITLSDGKISHIVDLS